MEYTLNVPTDSVQYFAFTLKRIFVVLLFLPFEYRVLRITKLSSYSHIVNLSDDVLCIRPPPPRPTPILPPIRTAAVVVYEYIPCARTLQQTHMCDPMKLTSFSSPFNTNHTVRPHSSIKSERAPFLFSRSALSSNAHRLFGMYCAVLFSMMGCGAIDAMKHSTTLGGGSVD